MLRDDNMSFAQEEAAKIEGPYVLVMCMDGRLTVDAERLHRGVLYRTAGGFFSVTPAMEEELKSALPKYDNWILLVIRTAEPRSSSWLRSRTGRQFLLISLPR